MENDKGLLRNPRFLIALVIVLMVMFAMYLPYALTPNFLQNERELSLSSIGILGSTLSIASVIFALVLGHINPLTGFLIGQFAMVSFTLLIWWGNGLPWYIPAYALVGGFRLCQSLKYAFVRPFVRDHEVGFAFGVTESAGFIAFIIAPILAGFLYERNPQNIYTVGLIILSVSLVLTILVMRFKRTLTKRYLESQAELRIGD